MVEEKKAQFVKAISVTSLAILLGMEGYQAPVRRYPILSTKAACSKIICKYAERALFNPMQYEDNNWMAVKIELYSSFYVVT